MTNFTLSLIREPQAPPLYQQIYSYILSNITSGLIKKDEKLPSVKSLANHLSVSSGTIELAYSLLVQEGYIYSRPKSGFYASDALFNFSLPSTPPAPLPDTAPHSHFLFDFRTNAVDTVSFPFKTWSSLYRRVLSDGYSLLSAGHPHGDASLRAVLAKYLREFRALNCEPSQIIIGAGIEYLLILLHLILPPSDIAVENPGYLNTAKVLRSSGRTVIPIPLDTDGLIPALLRQSSADILYITPSHQFPTGIIMPAVRRIELLNWASLSPNRFIIEDDYNSEFHFSGHPIPSLQGMAPEHVIYLSTFSRSLAPSIRIAYMVLPPKLLSLADDFLFSSTVSRFDQHTLAAFIANGHLSRHLNRMKTIYKRRRDLLLDTLKPFIPRFHFNISAANAGLHLLLSFPAHSAPLFFQNALHANIKLYKLADYRIPPDSAPPDSSDNATAILGYAGLSDSDIAEAIPRLFQFTPPQQ